MQGTLETQQKSLQSVSLPIGPKGLTSNIPKERTNCREYPSFPKHPEILQINNPQSSDNFKTMNHIYF